VKKRLLISTYLVILALFCSHCHTDSEELVHIPDSAFLDALLAQGIDVNGDGEVSSSEAESTSSLRIGPSGIRDLSGVEAFIHLDTLRITLNPLQGMDLSANTRLKFLECTHCELEELKLSANLLLQHLDCGRNQLEGLDLSANLQLTHLYCNNNLFSHLELGANPALIEMISCGNQLEKLDISANTALKKIGIDNMPMLSEVCVWTLPFPPPGVRVLMDYSPQVVFRTVCDE